MTHRSRARWISRACLVLASLLIANASNAQQPAPLSGSVVTIDKAEAGSCTVTLAIATPRAGDDVGLAVDLAEFREQTLTGTTTKLEFNVGSPLRAGATVKLRLNGAEVGMPLVVAARQGASTDPCRQPATATPVALERSPFAASAFFGEVVDTFAPDTVGDYKNPEAGSAQKLRTIFGVDFSYRLLGGESAPVQLWLRGETLHGVRTADIECNVPDPPPVCSDATPFPDRAKYILEHASSIEALVAPRLEFKTLQLGSDSPARLYAMANIGFIALERAPSVYKNYHFGLGLRTIDGTFEGSYIEVGMGPNELFSASTKRLKIDGLVSFSLDAVPGLGEAPRFFVEMFIDNNLGDGADSVQTFFGIDVDLKRAFGR